jgi:2-polyprenyl-3-methyl-5-hydroxy-6-metoxy-1,4-benzoquinol methylase/uncharacterized protein YbaR (Trm112 family)
VIAELDALLACPVDHGPLVRAADGWLECAGGHRFPVADGIPVLLRDDSVATIGIEEMSLKRARGECPGDSRAPELFLESLGLSEAEIDGIVQLTRSGRSEVDPVVQYLVGATCGIAFRSAIGRLKRYPIPEIPLPSSNGGVLIDLGCNWGRWSIAAARKGYRVIGLDPQLGALMAARRVARQLGQDISYVCADARHLPFAAGAVDVAFSYSVLQHFSREDCTATVREVARVLKSGGVSMIQMANALGVRSAYHLAKRRFREPKAFEVRYYMPGDLLALFEANIGRSCLSADCFLGLGLQATDRDLVSPLARVAIRISEIAKKVSAVLPPFRRLADSVYLESTKA